MEGLGKISHDMGSIGITVGVLGVLAAGVYVFAPELMTMGFDFVKEAIGGFFVPFG